MHIENQPIDSIRPYDKNAKKHNREQIKKVADSIQRFGWAQPLVVDGQGNLIIGHCRLESARFLHLEEVPVVKMENLTEEEVKALRLADNKLNESDWDMNLVIPELKGLTPELLDLTGFDKDLIIEPDEKDDEVPEVPEEPQSKLGDLYILGNHRVLCGDSTKIKDVERLMDGNKADMVFTDPPYNVDYQGGMYADGTQTKRRKILNDKMSKEAFYQFLLSVFSNLVKYTTGAFYVCMSSSELHNLWAAFTDSGGHWQSYIIWVKDHFTLSRSDYHHQFEPIMLGSAIEEHYDESEGDAILYGWTRHVWRGGRKQGNVWHFDRPKSSDLHPTMKPVMLCAKAIVNSSNENEIVCDVFLGSGSTLIASQKINRICYGMELDPKYVDVIVKRYVDYTGNENIIKNGEKIIWPKSVDQPK